MPLMGKRVVSWNDRVDGRSMRDVFKVVSQFYDDLDPMSEHRMDPVLVNHHVSTSVVCHNLSLANSLDAFCSSWEQAGKKAWRIEGDHGEQEQRDKP